MLRTKVLIIGAGPTGLMAACQLERYGVDYIIIDKKAGPTHESRALVVHARSLEIYEQLGICDEAMRQGQVVKTVRFLFGSKKMQELPFESVGEGLSNFPFLLVLEQSKNEELLTEYITRHESEVLWNTEMLSLQQDDEKVLVQLKGEKETYEIRADYLIAADGGRSTVRNALDIPFKGDTYEHIFYVADTAVDWKGGHEALNIYLFRQTFLALFPMKGENRFRVIGILPSSYQNEHPQRFEEIIPLIQKQIDIPLNFSDTNWFSVYRLHHRCIDHFRKGRVFFAGDAAHVHSPTGGQGMNTGLQDAYNLAWKLAYVVKGRAGDKLLDTYEQERLPFARQLINTTDKVFSFVTSYKWQHRFLRMRIVPLLLPLFFRLKRFRLRSFRTVSQIGIRYVNSDLTINRVKEALKIKAGERFPYLINGQGDSICSLMNKPAFYVLLFAPDSKSGFFDEAAALENEFRKMVEVLSLSSEKHIITVLGIKKEVIILVRPDHYIGLITDEGIKVVRDYLKEITTVEETTADE